MTKTLSRIETETVSLKVRDDQILEIQALDSMIRQFELEDIIKIVDAIRDLKGNYPNLNLFLVHIKNGKYSMEARKYLASQQDIAKKIAMIANKPMQVMVGNFFLGLNRPNIEMKLFTTKSKGEKWLKSKT